MRDDIPDFLNILCVAEETPFKLSSALDFELGWSRLLYKLIICITHSVNT